MSKGQVRFGSKMGVTEMSARMEETHLQRCGIDYYAFARLWLGTIQSSRLLRSRVLTLCAHAQL
jgi:hypothetical protein